jgi:hypothetical protein
MARLDAQNLMHCSEWIGIFSALFLRVVRASGLPKVYLDVKVILTPPCIFY